MPSAPNDFLLDATAPLPKSSENTLDPQGGGDPHTVYPFQRADALFVGVVDYASAQWQEDGPSFIPNEMDAVWSPSLSSSGYPSLSSLDGMVPLSATLDSTLDLPYGDDAHIVDPFQVANAPSSGVVDYHAQEDPLSFAPDDMDAVSPPSLPSLQPGYPSLPVLLDATAPLLTSLENTLDSPYGCHTLPTYPGPVAEAPSSGAIDYSTPALFDIIDPGIAGVSAHSVDIHDHPICPL